MQYRLRTLLMVLAVLPPLIWAGWLVFDGFRREVARIVIGGEVQPAYPADEQGEFMP